MNVAEHIDLTKQISQLEEEMDELMGKMLETDAIMETYQKEYTIRAKRRAQLRTYGLGTNCSQCTNWEPLALHPMSNIQFGRCKITGVVRPEFYSNCPAWEKEEER